MSPKYTLFYFPVRGRAEIIRLVFHAAGVTFEDKRIDPSTWPELKPKTPNGTLPYLDMDGQTFGESLPIARFIARKYNLMGKTEIDQFKADILLNICEDIKNVASRARNDKSLTDAQKADLEHKLKTELLPKFLGNVEKTLTENKHGFMLGSDISIADLIVYDIMETPLEAHPGLLDKCPKTAEHRKKIAAHPRLHKYLTTRPKTAI